MCSVALKRNAEPNKSSAPFGFCDPAERLCVGHPMPGLERGKHVAAKAIVGEKVGMTQVWDDQNRAIPVTVVRVSPARVVQVKTPEKEGYSAVQVTWGFRRRSTLNKPVDGHYRAAGVEPGRRLVELRLDDISDFTVGQQLSDRKSV